MQPTALPIKSWNKEPSRDILKASSGFELKIIQESSLVYRSQLVINDGCLKVSSLSLSQLRDTGINRKVTIETSALAEKRITGLGLTKKVREQSNCRC